MTRREQRQAKQLADDIANDKFRIMNGWLVVDVEECTCAGGVAETSYLHEPGCGYEPIAKLQDLLGPDEWEYGYHTGSEVTWLGTREAADQYAASFKPPAIVGVGDWGSRFVRRHPAGPWAGVGS